MQRIKHFVKNINGEEVYLVFIQMDNGEEIKASFDRAGNLIFVDSHVWDETLQSIEL